MIYLLFIKKYRNLLFITWFFIPYLIMTFFLYSKESRYFLPAYPAVAIISALFLISLKYKKLKTVLMLFFVIFGLYYFTETSWNLRYLSKITFLKPIFFSGYGYVIPTEESPRYGYTFPVKFDAKINEVIENIQKNQKDGKIVPKVAIVPNSLFFNSQQFNYYTALKKARINYSPSSKIRNSSYEQNLKESDFIVTKTGLQGPENFALFADKIVEMENQPDNEIFHQAFQLIKTIERGDNTTIKIYKKSNG